MTGFRIKTPKPKNVNINVNIYNAKKGNGIELFYNMKTGRIFIADYYQNCNKENIAKVSCVSDDAHLSKITVEYLMQEIERLKAEELNSREREKEKIKELRERYKERKKLLKGK